MNVPLHRYWLLLTEYLRPQRTRLVLLTTLLLAGIGLELLSPQVVRVFLDQAQAGAPLPDLIGAAVFFLLVTLVAQVVVVVETALVEVVSWTATNRLRSTLVAHCLSLDLSFHHARTPGELIERVDGDVTALATFFSRFVVVLLGNVLLLIGVLVLLWREDWRIGLLAALFAAVVLAAMLRLYAMAQPLWATTRQESALFYGFIGERLAGADDLRANGAVPDVLHRLSERMRRWLRLILRATLAEQIVWMVALSLFTIATSTALVLAAGLYRDGALTLGAVYLVAQYMGLLGRPVGQLQAQIRELQHAGVSIGRVEALFATQPALVDGAGWLPSAALAVDFEHVTFGYGTEAPVLADITFRLRPGETLGLLGRTGSGKTSIARLLVRLYDPAQGTIRLGGVDLRTVRLEDVRRRVGLVTQEVQLLGASLRDNLSLFDPALDDARLRAAIHDLGLGAWLASLPAGLDTELAAGGLSAGQAQLLAALRVFLRDPGLVILDEASSRLDPATERLLDGAIDRLLAGRTAIIIAHRLATVRRVDTIMVLEAGRIVEHGPRAALTDSARSRYAALLRADLPAERKGVDA